MSETRQQKVSAEIAKVISNALICKAKDPRFRFLNVSVVEVSKDLAYAKVYVNSWDVEVVEMSEVIEALNKATPWFQRELGKTLSLRITPRPRFILDLVPKEAKKIDDLLRQIRHTEH